jgi:hypothetical protein
VNKNSRVTTVTTCTTCCLDSYVRRSVRNISRYRFCTTLVVTGDSGDSRPNRLTVLRIVLSPPARREGNVIEVMTTPDYVFC